MPDYPELTASPNADLDRTDELPVLDLAAYEAKIPPRSAELVVHPLVESQTTWDGDRIDSNAALSSDCSASGIEEWNSAPVAQRSGTEKPASLRPDSPAEAAARADQLEAELRSLGGRLRAEFARMLDERGARFAILDTELAAVEARVAEAECGLASCAASISGHVATENSRELAIAAVARAVDGLRAETAERIAELQRLAADRWQQSIFPQSQSPAASPAPHPSHASRQVTDERPAPSGGGDVGYESRVRELEEARDVALQAAADRATALQAADVALAQHAAQLEASSDRLTSLERDVRVQATRFVRLEAELAAAKSVAEQADAQRRALEAALDRVASECALQDRRAAAIEVRHADLAMQLEASRRALEERNLQVRRLERQRTVRAQGAGAVGRRVESPARSPNDTSRHPADASATLVALGGTDVVRFALNGRTTIGRARDNNLCLRESSISRHHAVVIVGSNGAFIEDLATVNCVAVNGRRVRHAWLGEGDIITLGLRRFLFTTVARPNDEAG